MPVECAAASVWQPPQPALAKIAAPFAGLHLRWKAGTIGKLDPPPHLFFGMHATGVADPTPCDWHAASAEALKRRAAMRAIRRNGRDSNEAVRPTAVGSVARVA